VRPRTFDGRPPPARRSTDRYVGVGLLGTAALATVYGANIILIPEPFHWWHLLDAIVIWLLAIPVWWAGLGIVVHVRGATRSSRRPPPSPPTRTERPDR
jgi:hypothetical protein